MRSVLFSVLMGLFCFTAVFQVKQGEDFLEEGRRLHFDGKYDSARRVLLQARDVFVELKDLDQQIEASYAAGESMLNSGDCEGAQQIIQEALDLSLERYGANHAKTADGYYYLSRAYGGCARQFKKALETLSQSTKIRKELFGIDSYEVSFNLTMEGYFKSGLGNYDSAIYSLTEAVEIREREGVPEPLELSHTFSLLSTAYDRIGEVKKALDFGLKALAIREEVLVPVHPTISNSFNDIGNVYKNFGNFEQSLEYYERSLDIRKQTLGEDHVNVGASYYTIGNLYGSTFNYRRAIYFIEQGNLIMEAKYGVSAPILHTYYAYLGSMYGFVGDHDQAQHFLHLAETLAEENLRPDHPYLGIVYAFIGDYYFREGQVDLQLKYFEKARSIYLKAYGKGTIREADALVRLGEANLKLEKPEKANELYDEALAIYLEKLGKSNSKVSGLYQNLGRINRTVKEFEKAREYYNKSLYAIALDTQFVAPLDVSTFSHKHRAMRSFQQLGRIHLDLFEEEEDLENLKSSFQNYQFAIELVDHIITSYKLEVSKNQLEEEARSIYEEAIEVAHLLSQTTADPKYKHAAFELVEKSKSPILLSKIKDSESKKLNNVPEDLLQRERDMSIELSFYKEQLRKARVKDDSASIADFKREVFDSQTSLEQFKGELQRDFPAYYETQYGEQVADVERVRSFLSRRDAVLEYFEAKDAIYLFVITSGDFELIKIAKEESFDETMEGYQRSLTDGDFIISSPSQADSLFGSTSYSLFEMLVEPAEEYLSDASSLIVIPDGNLSALNFNTFLMSRPEGRIRFAELDYLMKSFNLSYAFSSSLNFRQNEKPSSFAFGGFAPSYDINTYKNLDSAAHPMAYQLVRGGKLELPGAISEVSELSEMLGGQSWVNTEATESDFKRTSSNYSIVHLAMHSLLNGEEPTYSELLFNGEKDQENDGYLTIEEIYNLDLNAEMVVLSACSSGSGAIQVGEGPISFTRAFSYAGCPSVVMSLWKVPDVSTKELMIEFYSNLKNGMKKDEALRSAQLSYLENTSDPLYQHPFYWGSFVAMGNTEPIQTTTTLRKSLAIVISLVVLLAFFRVRKKIHRLNR